MGKKLGKINDHTPLIVAGDSVFLGNSFAVEGTSGKTTDIGTIVSLDIKSGKQNWAYEMTGLDQQFLATANYVNGILLCVLNNSSMIALDATTGKIKWKYNPSSMVNPIVYENKVYIVDETLVALDLTSGKKMWKLPVSKEQEFVVPMYGLTFSNTTLVFAGFSQDKNQYVEAVDLKTGKEKWKHKTGNTTTPVISQGIVYFSKDKDGTQFCAVDWKQVRQCGIISCKVTRVRHLLLPKIRFCLEVSAVLLLLWIKVTEKKNGDTILIYRLNQ